MSYPRRKLRYDSPSLPLQKKNEQSKKKQAIIFIPCVLILKPVGDALKEWQKILLVERVQTLLFSIELKYSFEKQQYKMLKLNT